MKKILISLLFLSRICSAQTTIHISDIQDMYYSYKNCPVAGDNKRFASMDSMKNRGVATDSYSHMNFNLLSTADVNTKFNVLPTQGIMVEGYIMDMEKSGKESCDCHSDVYIDTHIYLAPDENHTDKSQCLIVEVTPRFREKFGDIKELKSKYLHSKVKVYGYLFCDEEHKTNSKADNGKGNLWRASCWEVHPVTEIE